MSSYPEVIDGVVTEHEARQAAVLRYRISVYDINDSRTGPAFWEAKAVYRNLRSLVTVKSQNRDWAEAVDAVVTEMNKLHGVES
jgi:hypothetical protein